MCVKFPSNVGGTSPLQPAAPKPANPAPEKTPAPVPDAPDINTKDNLKPTSPEFLKPPPFDPGEGNVHLCKYVPSEDGGLNVHKCVSRPGDGEGLQIYKCVAWTKVPDKLAEKLKEILEQQTPPVPKDLKEKIKDLLNNDNGLDKIIQKIKDAFPDKPVGPTHLCITELPGSDDPMYKCVAKIPDPELPTGPVHLCVAEVPDPDSPIGPVHLCIAEVPDPENPIGPVHLCVAEVPNPDDPIGPVHLCVAEVPNPDDPIGPTHLCPIIEPPGPTELEEIQDIDDLPDDIRELLEEILNQLPPDDGGMYSCVYRPEPPEFV